ncbi:MAG: asparaginase [Chloroflexi bacterium]|nr:asparaginase [Chloroflexota bacterium]
MCTSLSSRIVLITTGGTIAGVYDQTGTILMNADQSGWASGIFELRPELRTMVQIEFDSCLNVFSEDMTPTDWATLAQRVADWVSRGVTGIVISHGTDTLAYTSAALSYMLPNLPIPVVVTGATKPLAAKGTDALRNLCDSVVVAAHSSLRGVYVVFASTIHGGTRVRKMASKRRAFESINCKTVGIIRGLDVQISNNTLLPGQAAGRFTADTRHDPSVAFLKVYPGLDPAWIDLAVESKRAILLELYVDGAACTQEGNAYSLTEGLKRAKTRGVPVFATSQQKSALDLTRYESTSRLHRAGVVSLCDMTTEAALPKLMWVLGHASEPEQIKMLMLRNIAHELSEVISSDMPSH